MIESRLEIVFSSSVNGEEDIYAMDKDGHGLRRLTHISRSGETNRTPEWSPDKRQIVFQSNREGVRALYIFSLTTGEFRRLTRSNHDCAHPAWNPDGKRLAFTSNRGNGSALYQINTDGMNEALIPLSDFEKRNFFNPCWTPDGRDIIFVLQGENGASDSLWKVEIEGKNLVRIGPEDLSLFEFDLSPDGQTIVFDRKISSQSPLGDWDIFTMRVDGSNITRLTNSVAMSSRPKFLANGRIVFHTNRYGRRFEQPAAEASLEEWFSWWNEFEICTMNADGTDVLRLTSNTLRDLHPDG